MTATQTSSLDVCFLRSSRVNCLVGLAWASCDFFAGALGAGAAAEVCWDAAEAEVEAWAPWPPNSSVTLPEDGSYLTTVSRWPATWPRRWAAILPDEACERR